MGPSHTHVSSLGHLGPSLKTNEFTVKLARTHMFLVFALWGPHTHTHVSSLGHLGPSFKTNEFTVKLARTHMFLVFALWGPHAHTCF